MMMMMTVNGCRSFQPYLVLDNDPKSSQRSICILIMIIPPLKLPSLLIFRSGNRQNGAATCMSTSRIAIAVIKYKMGNKI